MALERDPGLDTLLELDGVSLFIDAEGRYRVRFVVKRVDVSSERPHGLSYSLTLHDETGTRLVGFDNAHPVASGYGSGKSRRPRSITVTVERLSGSTIIGMPPLCSLISGCRSKPS
jgi:hypothetical protein